MTLESVGVTIAIIGGIMAIIGNAVAITWTFGRLSAKLDTWIASFSRFEDGYKEHKIDTKSKITALFERQDELRDKVTTLEAQK